MTKNILLSLIALGAMTTTGFAGGELVPNYEPVITEPEEVEALEEEAMSDVYIGVGPARGRYFSDCGNGECSYEDITYGVLVRGGYNFSEYFGIEARLVSTFLDAGPLGGQTLSHFGIFAKPMVDITPKVNLYTLLGYGMTKTKNDGKLETVDDAGFSAGAGVEFGIGADENASWKLFADYQRLLIKSDTPDLDVISAGVNYHF